MNVKKLERMFELTKEVVLAYNCSDPCESNSKVIQSLNDELWKAGYMTWIIQKDGKACLSVQPRSTRRSPSSDLP